MSSKSLVVAGGSNGSVDAPPKGIGDGDQKIMDPFFQEEAGGELVKNEVVDGANEDTLQNNHALHVDTNVDEGEGEDTLQNIHTLHIDTNVDEAPGINVEMEQGTNVSETAGAPSENNDNLHADTDDANNNKHRDSQEIAPQHVANDFPNNDNNDNTTSPSGMKRRLAKNKITYTGLTLTPSDNAELDSLYPTNTSTGTTMKRRGQKGGSSSSEAEDYLDVENQQPKMTPDADQDSSQSSSKGKYKKAGGKSSSAIMQSKLMEDAGETLSTTNHRVLLRKIFIAIITDVPDEVLRHPDTDGITIIITLIKEVILGVIIAFFVVSFILFLDHKLLLGLPTARTYRKATFQLMSDNETLTHLEEYAGLRFLDVNEYNSGAEEMADVPGRINLTEAILAKRAEDLVEMEQETLEDTTEFKAMMKELGLDKFCEDCTWSPALRLTCMGRVNALGEKYQTPRFMAMLDAMKKPSCILSKEMLDKQEKERQKAKDEEVNLRKVWEAKKSDFCEHCEWDMGLTCQERAAYLFETYKTPLDVAKASLIEDEKDTKCSLSARAKEDKYMERLCRECIWGPGAKLSCQKRVDLLMVQYKITERKAILDAMKKPACVKPE